MSLPKEQPNKTDREIELPPAIIETFARFLAPHLHQLDIGRTPIISKAASPSWCGSDTRTVYDESGCPHACLDEYMKSRLENKLIRAILGVN